MIQIAVMHDERRAVMLRALRGTLERQMCGGYSPSIAVGHGTSEGAWAAMRAALELALVSAPVSVTHVLLVEDDAVPCEGFLQSVRRAVDAVPDQVLYFFATAQQGGEWMNRARAHGAAWTPTDARAFSTLACVIPVEDARQFLAYYESHANEVAFLAVLDEPGLDWRNVSKAGDARLWHWLRAHRRVGMLSTWSLCEHGAASPGDSLTGMSHAYHRIAHNPVKGLRPMGDAEAVSALEIDWTK